MSRATSWASAPTGSSLQRRAVTAVAAIVLVSAGTLRAQEPRRGRQDADTLLTLDEALELAAERNPELLQAENELDRAGAERLAGRAAFLPSVSASTGFDVTRTRRFTTQDVFGDLTKREEAVEATTRGAHQSVFLDMTLFDGGEALATMRSAGDRYQAVEAALVLQRAVVRAEVSRAYFDLMERRRTATVEAAILAARERDVATTERLFRVVAADQIDVLGARIEARRQEAAVAAAEEAAVVARLALAEAIGTDIDPDASLDVPFEPFDPQDLDVDDLVREALAAHPDLVRLRQELEAARAEAWNDGWLAYLPRVAASASYNRSEFGGTETPFFNLDPRNSAWGLGLSLTLPLFDRFERNVERARDDAAARNAALAVRARERQAETEVRSRYLDLRAAYRQLEVERETAAMAAERADLARQKYEIGALDFTSLQQIVDQATSAERTLVQRRFDTYRALVELERAAGQPLPSPGAPPFIEPPR